MKAALSLTELENIVEADVILVLCCFGITIIMVL